MKMTNAADVSRLLDKMDNLDKDIRYMSINDLKIALSKENFCVNSDLEGKMVKKMLGCLRDHNSEVQDLAVNTLKPLISAISDTQKEVIVEELCKNLSRDDVQLRTISIVGVKLAIMSLPVGAATSGSLLLKLTWHLIENIENIKQGASAIRFEALSLMGELFRRYGVILTEAHSRTIIVLLELLSNPTESNQRQPIISAVAALSTSLALPLFTKVMDYMIDNLNKCTLENGLVFVQLASSLMRTCGHRMGSYVDSCVPAIIKMLNNCDDDEDFHDEIRENCVKALGSCVESNNCKDSVIEEIFEIGLKFVAFDPNYCDDDDSDSEDFSDSDDDSEEDMYDEGHDASHKIRSASANLLSVIIENVNGSSTLSSLVTTRATPVLNSRFKERNENVKIRIFDTYISLLKLIQSLSESVVDCNEMEIDNDALSLLSSCTDTIIKDIESQFKAGNKQVNLKCFEVGRHLIKTLKKSDVRAFSALIHKAEKELLNTKSEKSILLECIYFLEVAFEVLSSDIIKSHMSIVYALCNCTNHEYYKISANSFKVLSTMIPNIRPNPCTPSNAEELKLAESIFSSVDKFFEAPNLDEDVRKASILCMGNCIAYFGDLLQSSVPYILNIFVSRFSNQNTCLCAITGLLCIIESPLAIDISPVFNDLLPAIVNILKMSDAKLNTACFKFLFGLIKTYPNLFFENSIKTLIENMSNHIRPRDLQVTSECLKLLSYIVSNEPGSVQVFNKEDTNGCFSALKELIYYPNLYSSTLDSLLDFLSAIVETKHSPFEYEYFFNELCKPMYFPCSKMEIDNSSILATNRLSFTTISKCVAILITKESDIKNQFVSKLVKDVSVSLAHSSNEANCARADFLKHVNISLIAMLCLGEIGCISPLNNVDDVLELLESSFVHPLEEIKVGGSQALGLLVCGDIYKLFPGILNKIKCVGNDEQYIWLQVLKQILSESLKNKNEKFGLDFAAEIMPVLFNFALNNESKKNVIAECIGKLSLLKPDVELLSENLESNDENLRIIIAMALKYCLNSSDKAAMNILRPAILKSVLRIKDDNVDVRRTALVTLNSIINSHKDILVECIEEIFPLMINETNVNQNLVREYKMMNEKIVEDAGKECRTAAFECIYSLLEKYNENIDFEIIITQVIKGCDDDTDIRLLAHLILIRLAKVSDSTILKNMDEIAKVLTKCIKEKPSKNAMPDEIENLEDRIQSGLRVISRIQEIQDVDQTVGFSTLIKVVESSPSLSDQYNEALKEKRDSLTS